LTPAEIAGLPWPHFLFETAKYRLNKAGGILSNPYHLP
jgi:hypothetical protein